MSGIIDPSEPFFKDGAWGWDGEQWRKLPLVWGYSDEWFNTRSNTNADVGDNVLTFSTVAAGKVVVVTNQIAYCVQAGLTDIRFYVVSSSTEYFTAGKLVPGAGEFVGGQCHLVLKAGSKIRAKFYGCTAGDDIYGYLAGYEMSAAE